MPPSVHLEAGWFPYDRLSLVDDDSVFFNSYYDNRLPQAFEGRIGIGSPPDQLVRASADLGLGYLLRETEPGIEWVGPSYLRDARGSLNFELGFKVPGKKKGGALFGLGGGPTLDLLTSRRYNPEFACLDVEENCQQWMEAGGVPTEDGTRIELDKAWGLGGKGYGILGVALGPVTVLLRGGPQILYVPSVDLTEAGLFTEAALRVNFGGASDPDPVSVVPAPPVPPLPPLPPRVVASPPPPPRPVVVPAPRSSTAKDKTSLPDFSSVVLTDDQLKVIKKGIFESSHDIALDGYFKQKLYGYPDRYEPLAVTALWSMNRSFHQACERYSVNSDEQNACWQGVLFSHDQYMSEDVIRSCDELTAGSSLKAACDQGMKGIQKNPPPRP